MAEPQRYSNEYRSTETQKVMNWIKARQCGCLVGLRGVGKSDFARFLLQEETRRYHLGPTYSNFVFVLLDLLALIEHTDWAVYELILDRLLSQVRPFIEKSIAEEIALLHREITQNKDPRSAQRAIERSMDILCQPPDRRIVWLLDGFDTVFATLTPSLFSFLRTVRDNHKDQLLYLVITEKDLANLRYDLSGLEHFYRLVSRNVYYLGPFTKTDAQHMIQHRSAQRSVELQDTEIEFLIELSGGHAGLLKALLTLFWDTREKSSLLNSQPIIQAECRQIWEGLSPKEQAALCAVSDDRRLEAETEHHLERRGLVWPRHSASPLFFSPLFAAFVHEQGSPVINGVMINRSIREVWIAGRQIDHLTELEFETLCYFCEHPGRVCSKDELIANIYAHYEKAEEGVTDEALQALISRLREKIEPDRERPRYLITVRGRGYRFVEPGRLEQPVTSRSPVRGR
jgi:DNA-binding winged helix-turn-helix (wHTH) protein